MYRLRLLPEKTDFPFMTWRQIGFRFSIALMVISIALFFVRGLNFGIDFLGGVLMEVKVPEATELADLRSLSASLGLGEVSLQEFGDEDQNVVLIRIQKQPGGDDAQQGAIAVMKDALDAKFGADPGDRYRRTEAVGPAVGEELIWAAVQAIIYALLAMMVYIWFRFEWQFSVGAVVALIHDVIATIGVFALLQFEFNLATVAAILLIVGYSMNDTVVVYDRVRENLRKFKKMSLPDLLSRSVNDTLSRTVMTSATTLLALLALIVLGGPVIRDFCFAMIWGVIVGTYSSIFIAAPLLILFGLENVGGREAEKASPGNEGETN